MLHKLCAKPWDLCGLYDNSAKRGGSPFIDLETEAQRSEVTHARAHSE